MKRIIWIILLIPFIAHAESIKLVLIQSLGDSFVDYSHTEVHFFAGPQKADVYKIREENPDFYKYLFFKIYHSGEYVTLQEYLKYTDGEQQITFRQRTKSYEPKIRNEIAHYCGESEKTIECILSSTAEVLDIKECSNNVDLGYYCEVCGGKTVCTPYREKFSN